MTRRTTCPDKVSELSGQPVRALEDRLSGKTPHTPLKGVWVCPALSGPRSGRGEREGLDTHWQLVYVSADERPAGRRHDGSGTE